MPRNGSGTYSPPANTAAVANSTASSTAFNSWQDDVSTALTESINKDGTKAMAAALAMGGFKVTGMAVGTALTDAASVTQVQNNTVAWVDGGGTADVITATYSPAVTTLADGMILGFRATAANATTTPTFAPNGLTAHTIVKGNGAALAAGDIVGDGHECLVRYDATNTQWCLVNPFPAAAAGASPADTTTAGISELATTTEVLTGTAATNIAVTPDANAALWEQGSDIASAATISIGEGGYFHVTGTTGITDIDFATTKAGRKVTLVFDGALIITHNGTTLICPTAANITTAAGDTCDVVSEGGDNVRITNYVRKSGSALTSPASTATVIRKASSESVTSSTTLQNDDDFSFAVSANTKYYCEISLYISSGDFETEGGFKYDFTGPASPTSVSYMSELLGIQLDVGDSGNATATASTIATAFSTAHSYAPFGSTAGITGWTRIKITFYLNNGVNAGTVQFRWAQNTSDGVATTIAAGSILYYEAVS